MRTVRPKYVGVALLAIGSAVLVTACGRSAETTARKEFAQVYAINPDATFSLANFSGSVVIHGSDLPQLEVKAIITATNSQRLNGITVDVKARDDRAAINTIFPPEKRRVGASGGQVDYVLRLPRTVRISQLEIENGRVSIEGMRSPDLNARVVDGSLSVHNCLGDARLAVSSGSLELSYDSLEQDPFFVSALIIHGNARVVMPTGSPLHLLADASSGKVINHLAETVELNGHSSSRVDMKIGPNTRPDFEIRATMGDIEILPVKALAKE